MAIPGLVATFAPAELLTWLNVPAHESLPIIIQIMGALYFGFALTNWIAKDSIIGSIYSRPLSLGNFTHFTVAAFALIKYEMANGFRGWLFIAMLAYTVLAIGFGYLIFGRGAVGNQ